MSEPLIPDLDSVGSNLESAVRRALAALEQSGVSAREADEFIRDCVFTAWWDWDYEVPELEFEVDVKPETTPRA